MQNQTGTGMLCNTKMVRSIGNLIFANIYSIYMALLVNLYDLFSDDLKRYFDEKLNQVKLELAKKIDSAKRSIQYDLDRKINEINNNIMFSSRSTLQHGSDARKKINTPLPITDLEDFLKFERSLQNDDEETKNALVSVYNDNLKTC